MYITGKREGREEISKQHYSEKLGKEAKDRILMLGILKRSSSLRSMVKENISKMHWIERAKANILHKSP